MRSLLLALVAAGLLVLAFPPYSQAWLTPVALALFLYLVRTVKHRFLVGTLFGFAFFTGLIYWVGELGVIAVAPLIVVFGLYPGLFAWAVGKAKSDQGFAVAAVAGWALLEAIRVRFPVGGFEWGLTGYPMVSYVWTRHAASLIGASGWGVVLIVLATGICLSVLRRQVSPWLFGGAGAVAVMTLLGAVLPPPAQGGSVRVAIVQGSTPCPLTHCIDERYATYLQHLDLTRTIPTGTVDLVVWPEGSTGSVDADPVLVPEVAAAIGAEAERIGAYFLVGGDRVVSDSEWINANVVFSPEGEIVGEYRKRHPVPFGEYIPARPVFDWIPALAQVPRDMIRGEAPVVFDFPIGNVGSVISFEGTFARYGRDEAKAGAQLLVVATNEGSYEFTPVSDQFIAMTRMRSAETGLDHVHAAVTGKSTFVTDRGDGGRGSRVPRATSDHGRARARHRTTHALRALG